MNSGAKLEKHLCDAHAIEDGLANKPAHTPINELLSNFVKVHTAATGGQVGEVGEVGQASERAEPVCENCGMTFAKFREKTLLGCPHCYRVFEKPLVSLLERAQEGHSSHMGKVPRRAGASEARQVRLTRMRRQLEEALGEEDYETAARLRDELQAMETEP